LTRNQERNVHVHASAFPQPTNALQASDVLPRRRSDSPGRIIYIAGQLGLDVEGKLVGAAGDFRAQAKQTFENLKLALAAVGANFNQVVKLNNYLTDITHLAILREVRDQFINTAAPPASTTLQISGLARPGALIEIEAVAMLSP
jgi:enamine deaminase RidA (YjgF/YER057c/UK114 family)